MSPEWLAGFVQGEGCIAFYRTVGNNGRTVYFYPRVTITQKEVAVLEDIRLVYGGCLRLRTDKASDLAFNKGQAARLCRILAPHLLGSKKRQALLLLAAMRLPAKDREMEYEMMKLLKRAF